MSVNKSIIDNLKKPMIFKILACLSIILLILYIVISKDSAQSSKQQTQNAIEPLLTEMNAYYTEKFSSPIKEGSINTEKESDKWECAVYMNKSSDGEALLPRGFMIKDDAFFIADTAAYRVVQAYPGKIYQQAFINSSVIIMDVWINTDSDYYILGYSDGLQIYHCDGRQFQKLNAEFSGLDSEKYIKAYFCDKKVIIVEPDNSIYYYDLDALDKSIESPFDLTFSNGCIKDAISGKEFKMDIFDSSTLYPIGKDKSGNVYFVCNKVDMAEQFLVKLDIQQEKAQSMKIEYNPLICNDIKLNEEGKLLQMVFGARSLYIKELRFMDRENTSAAVSEEVTGTINTLPLKQNLLSVSFIDSNTGYLSIAEKYGLNSTSNEYKLLKTLDGGNNWSTVSTGIPLYDLKFVTELKGFAYSDNKLLMTEDGGCNWEPPNFKGINNISRIQAINEKLIFAVTNPNEIYVSSNGGLSWEYIRAPKENLIPAFMSWVSKKEGYLLYSYGRGAGFEQKELYYTADGGKSWTLQASSGYNEEDGNDVPHLDAGGYANGIHFFQDGTGYFGASRGYLVKTKDRGLSYESLVSPTDTDYNPLPDFIDEKEGYAISGYNYFNQLYKTVDGGNSWKQIYPLNISIGPISFSSASQGIGVVYFPDNETYISSTADGEKTWTKLFKVENSTIESIKIAEDGTIWALAIYRPEDVTKLLRSRDGGHNWDTVKVLNNMAATFSAINSDICFVGNCIKEMYKTTDGGDTWISIPQQEEVWYASFAYDDYGWAFANGGIPVKTTDGGQTWKPFKFDGIDVLSDILLIDKDNFVITGRKDSIYSILLSQDGGHNFKRIIFNESSIKYIDLVNPNTIYAVIEGTLYMSSDGGTTFKLIEITGEY